MLATNIYLEFCQGLLTFCNELSGLAGWSRTIDPATPARYQIIISDSIDKYRLIVSIFDIPDRSIDERGN
jgi:hypothetical protein